MKNQLTPAIISLVLAATMTTPMYVFADEETVRTYEGEGYEVTYYVDCIASGKNNDKYDNNLDAQNYRNDIEIRGGYNE